MKSQLFRVGFFAFIMSFSHQSEAQNFTPAQLKVINTLCKSFQDTEAKIESSCSTAGDIDRCIQIQSKNLYATQYAQGAKVVGRDFDDQAFMGLKSMCIMSGYKTKLFQ